MFEKKKDLTSLDILNLIETNKPSIFGDVNNEIRSIKEQLNKLKYVKPEELDNKISEIIAKINGIDSKTAELNNSIQNMQNTINSIQIPDIKPLENSITALQNRLVPIENRTVDLTPLHNKLGLISEDFDYKFKELVNVLDTEAKNKLSFTKGEDYKKNLMSIYSVWQFNRKILI